MGPSLSGIAIQQTKVIINAIVITVIMLKPVAKYFAWHCAFKWANAHGASTALCQITGIRPNISRLRRG